MFESSSPKSTSTLNYSTPTSDKSYTYSSDIYYSSLSGESPQTNPAQQIFDFFSRTFGRKINTPNEIVATVSKLLKKYVKIQESLDSANQEIDNMNEELQEAAEHNELADAEVQDNQNTVNIVVGKLKEYKKKVLKLQDSNTEKDVKINQLQLDLENMKTDYEKRILELQDELRKSQEAPKPEVKRDDIQETAKVFEDLVIAQEQQIQELNDEKLKLLNVLHKYQEYTDVAEKKLNEISSLQASSSQQNDSLQQELNKLKEEQQTLMDEIEQEMPEDTKDALGEKDNLHDYALNAIRVLNNKVVEISQLTDACSVASIHDIATVPAEKYSELISHLEDAVKFIRNIISSSGATNGEEVRAILMSQCARIGNFIDTNILELGIQKIPQQYSIFDPHAFDGPEKQLAEFYKFASEDDLKSSPVRELYAVFQGIADVNLLLLEHIEKLKKQLQETVSNTISPDIFKKLQNENFDLLQWRAQNEDRIETMEKIMRLMAHKDDNEPLDLASIFEEAQNHEAQLQGEIDNLQKQYDNIVSSFDEFKTTANEAIDSLTKSLAETREALEQETTAHETESKALTKQNAALEKQLKNLQEEYSKVKTDISAQLKDKTRKCKQLGHAQKETRKILDSIQLKMNKAMETNEDLSHELAKLQEVSRLQKEKLDAMAEVEKKLRDSRDNLKIRLLKAQKINEEVLQGATSKNEIITARVTNAIENAKADADEARKEAENLQAQLNAATEQINQLQREISMSRVHEKAMALKLSSMNQKVQTEKAILDKKANALEQALRVNQQHQINQSELSVENCRNNLIQLLEKEDEGESIEDLVSLLKNKFTTYSSEKKILADAIQTRKELGIKTSQTLYDFLQKAREEKEHVLSQMDECRDQCAEMQHTVDKTNEKITEMSKYVTLNDDWVNWSKRMECEIAGDSITDGTPNATRTVLEEAILLGKGNRAALNRLSILRDEKKILQKNGNILKRSNKETSFTSLVTVINFAHRIQALSGCAPSAIPGLSRFV